MQASKFGRWLESWPFVGYGSFRLSAMMNSNEKCSIGAADASIAMCTVYFVHIGDEHLSVVKSVFLSVLLSSYCVSVC